MQVARDSSPGGSRCSRAVDELCTMGVGAMQVREAKDLDLHVSESPGPKGRSWGSMYLPKFVPSNTDALIPPDRKAGGTCTVFPG